MTSLEHTVARDYDVPAIDSSRVRAIMLTAPKSFQGTMAILDEGPSSKQVLASDLVPSQIPAAGVPLLFEPGTDAGTHHIKVFLSNSAGMPSSAMTLSSYRAPPVRKPTGLRIVRILRHGSNVQIAFRPGDAPIADGIGLALSTRNGERLDDLFSARDLHAVGAVSGIGASAQAGEYTITLHDVDPTETIKVAIFGSNDGETGPAASSSMGPAIRAMSPAQFLVALRKRHRHR